MNPLPHGHVEVPHGSEPAGLATSSFRATWLVPRGRLDEAVGLLHALFIEQQDAANIVQQPT